MTFLESPPRSVPALGAALAQLLVAFPVAVAAADDGAIEGSDGLVLERWASEPMFKNPVALDIDPQGRVFVTETVRRKAADLDIRQFRAWVPTDLSLTSVEEKRAFYRRELIPENGARYRSIGDQNGDGVIDWRDLTVLSDRIYRLEDSDGDGKADRSTLFAAGFDTEVTDIAAGILCFDGQVYATVAPDFWKLTDTDDDGVADERQSLAHGFGVHIAYAGHNMHGPTLGPDGRIYWSVADKGTNVTSREGAHHFYPDRGTVMRCEPDGSRLEVFAHGVRNTQELAFDALGNLFAVDNDGDMRGEKERYLYLTEGSDSGWRTNWQYRMGDYNPWMDEDLSVTASDGQPAHITPAIGFAKDGPAGFAYNPGTALSETFHDHFFVTWFPGGTISALRMVPDGAAFAVEDERVVARGRLFVGINFGPDGALYACDWSADGYELNEMGGIWRMDVDSAAGSARRQEVAELLRAEESSWDEGRLAELLGHADQRVRLRSQFALAKRGAAATLVAVLRDGGRPQVARVHALWGLGQMGRQGHGEVGDGILAAALADADPEIRAQAAKVAGELPSRSGETGAPLVTLLADESERAGFLAAIALGKLEVAGAVAPLVALLEEKGGHDPFLRHAAVSGLVGCADLAALESLATHPSVAVRVGAVVALRRVGAPEVATFLHDADRKVVAEAARAIHDDWSIPAALPALAALGGAALGDEAVARRVISANLRLRDVGGVLRILEIAADGALPVAVRVAALGAVAQWPDPEVLDTVEGRHRPLDPVAAAEVARLAKPALAGLLGNDIPREVASAAADAALAIGAGADAGEMADWVADASRPVSDRASALEAVVASGDERAVAEAVQTARRSDQPLLRVAALRVMAARHPETFPAIAAEALQTGSIPEKQTALGLLAVDRSEGAVALVAARMEALSEGRIDPAIQLDVLEAARAMESDTLSAAVRAYEATKDPGDPLAAFRESLEGGDPARGEDIFANNIAAQCMLCHRVGESGSQVGPELSQAGARSTREQLLESLVLPSAVVAQGFGFSTLTLHDGSTVSGTLAGEDDGVIHVGTPDGATVEIAREGVASQTPPVSTMPPMGTILNPREIRDLIAYLAGLK
ncbi:c-type cytochrome [soil metagenome]